MPESNEEVSLPEALTKPKTAFNPKVHEVTDNGDPKRNLDGSIALKKKWQDVATDRQGRIYNKRVHGDKIKLDDDGYLTVIRREAKAPPGSLTRLGAFVDLHREPGYDYYVFNDEPGELADAESRDWEPVTTKQGTATIPVGQARSPGTTGHLYRKLQEWRKADRNLKSERNQLRYEQNASPSKEDGQYSAAGNSPLR